MNKFTSIQEAIEFSIRRDAIARVTVEAVDIHAALVEAGVDADDMAQENDGSWDVWGGEGGGEWRIRVTVEEAPDEELTASEVNDSNGRWVWTVVDSSGQRFWPAEPCVTAAEALEAVENGRGEWVQ